MVAFDILPCSHKIFAGFQSKSRVESVANNRNSIFLAFNPLLNHDLAVLCRQLISRFKLVCLGDFSDANIEPSITGLTAIGKVNFATYHRQRRYYPKYKSRGDKSQDCQTCLVDFIHAECRQAPLPV